MGNFNIFNSLKKTEQIKDVSFSCPSCGAKCSISEEKCHDCSYDLSEYKSILFTGYLYFNSAVLYASENKYQEAIVDAAKFVALFPLDEEGYKLYIYLLGKNGLQDRARAELEVFEHNFPMNPWLMEVEKNGIDKIECPVTDKKPISVEKPVASLIALSREYTNYRIKNTNDIIDLTIHFYDLVSLLKRKQNQNKKNDYSFVVDFYEKNFLSFLSKKEIRIESFDGRIYNELTDDELKIIDVIGTKTDKKLKDGQIVTIYPALFLRSKMISKQKVQINKLSKK